MATHNPGFPIDFNCRPYNSVMHKRNKLGKENEAYNSFDPIL